MVAEASDEEEEALVYRSSLAQSMQQNAGLQRAMTLLSPQSIDAVADVDEEMALGARVAHREEAARRQQPLVVLKVGNLLRLLVVRLAATCRRRRGSSLVGSRL